MPQKSFIISAAAAALISSTTFYLGTKFPNLFEHTLQTIDYISPIDYDEKSSVRVSFDNKLSRSSQIMRFGFPGFDNLRTFEDYIVSYDRRNRTPHWVMEHLTAETIAFSPDVDRSKSEFKPDTSIHPYFRALNEDYRRSGYDRGHMAAAANHRRTQVSMDQTFILSNMAPQVGKGFNRDKWNELEKYVRHLVKKSKNIYVCSGPLYLPYKENDGNFYVKYKVIGERRVAVPTHFFKAVLIERGIDEFELEVYLMPNAPIPDEKPLNDFLVPIDTVERAAGFLIYENLPSDKLKKINGRSTGTTIFSLL